jgi:hypothetical protein
VICVTAADPTEPNAPLGFWMPFYEAIVGCSTISIDLEVFRLDVNGDVLVVVFVFNLGTDDPLEYLLPALGKL